MTPIEEIISEIGGHIVDHKEIHDRLRSKYGDEALELAIAIRNEARQKIETRLWKGQKSLSDQELDDLVMSVVDSDYPQYNRTAMASILGYIGWYSWHEGFMK